MDDLTEDLLQILDTVIHDLRLGATSKRRIQLLVSAETTEQRWQTVVAAVRYLQAHSVPSTDPLSEQVVQALVGGAVAAPRPTRQGVPARPPGAGRDRKARELARLPKGLRVEYDGMGATVRGGALYLDDGQRFDSPSAAARHVTGQKSVNGWAAWRVVDDGRSLAAYYDQPR